MNRKLARVLLFLAPLALLSLSASAASIPVGYISFDVTIPTGTAAFDISNQTGPNSSLFPDPTWPIASSEHFDSTAFTLTVHFNDGSTTIFGPSYFTLAADLLSFDGGTIPIGGSIPQPTSATLTGTFLDTTITLNDGSVVTILPGFTATILPSSGLVLQDSDLAIINATSVTVSGVPEPGTLPLMLTGMLGLLLILARKRLPGGLRALGSGAGRGAMPLALLLLCLLLIPASQASAAVHLNVGTTPGSGVAGVTDANVTGSGFPSGTITPSNVQVLFSSLGCFFTSADPTKYATTTAISIKHILGTSNRVHFLIPGSLASGLYEVWITDSAAGDANFTSGNCSQIQVTHTNPTLAACVPSSSLGVLSPVKGPANVTAYVPNAAWDESFTGIQVVQIENSSGPLDPPISVATVGAINSCAANPATNEVVCVDKLTGVYELTGSTVNTILPSGSNATASFSGGTCENCGVVIDSLNNRAVISMGTSAGPGTSGQGVQLLDLATNTFGTPFEMNLAVSENPLIDPTRSLILTPGENPAGFGNSDFTLLQVGSGGTLTELSNPVVDPMSSGEFDSAGEDCSTGIGVSTDEFTGQLIFVDLKQALVPPTTPAGTWTAGPGNSALNVEEFPEFNGLSAGTSAVSIAQGSSHLGIVNGEFAGSTYGVILLPSTSGSGTPSAVDYAYAVLPPLPTGATFFNGLDPHTTTAYTSPNDGKAWGLLSNGYFALPTFLGKIDLACVLAQPRFGVTHTVIGDAASCVTYIPTGN
jgi:hypothetical protein